MEEELKRVRDELCLFENKLINLIDERINLGNEVAIIKYKYLCNELNFSSDSEIYNYITNNKVEENIYARLDEKIEDKELAKIIIELYKHYIIPKTKELQVNKINELKAKNLKSI